MNKMAEAAKIFGVELGEKFKILNDECKLLRHTFFFDKDGLKYDGINGEWIAEDIFLYLFTGVYHIKKTPWKAKKYEKYYVPDPSMCELYRATKNIEISDDAFTYERGFMCKTQEQAEEIAKAMIKVARRMQGFDEEQGNE